MLERFISYFLLQLISEKLEDLEPRATEVLSRSETVQSSCGEKEYDSVKRAASKFRLQWNNLNQVNMEEYEHLCWEARWLMVNVLVSGVNCPGSSPGRRRKFPFRKRSMPFSRHLYIFLNCKRIFLY